MSFNLSVSNALYALASFFSIVNLIAIVVIHWSFIWSGKGLGSFTVPWFIAYFALSFALWGIAFLIERSWGWTLLYWASIAVPVLMFILLPIKFYIE